MRKGTIIQNDFYTSDDVVGIARKLLGKVLVYHNGSVRLAGCIVETEAYAGISDRASHAFGSRLTARTQVMYRNGGIAYLYLCYGLHNLLNVVTSTSGNPHAVLIRGIIPIEGIPLMEKTKNRKIHLLKDGIGPGKLTKLLGINQNLNGAPLDGSRGLFIEDSYFEFSSEMVIQGKRIGVDYAGEDALLPYRFRVDVFNALNAIKKAGLL
ncbi:MAG: DNA-3-methyladenine glycosylase [Lentimicrobium sp.]|nr:DNA-3-methyladenine glycosylase [Lentimicrobium sp.]